MSSPPNAPMSTTRPLSAIPHPATPRQQAPRFPAGSPRVPSWGFGDVLLGFPFFLVFGLIGLIVGAVIGGVDGLMDVVETGDAALLPVGMLAVSLIFQQLGQGLWPVIVSRWKGRGPVADWRFRFEWQDLGIGVGVAFIGLAGAGLVGWLVGVLVGLTDESSADNSQFLRDVDSNGWLAVLLFTVVVGAPLTEELFFRGLTLRAVEKRLGSAWAIVLSAVVFTLPHWTGSDWRGTVTLFASIFVVGLVLGAAAVMTDRIASSIIAHQIFNAVGAAGALGWLDQLAP